MDSAKSEQVDGMIAKLKHGRLHSYREQALRLYPHVCARCGRDFAGKQLKELTVHHKDHNHDHNPSDGSNWELLCIYCHDNEHQRMLEADAQGEISKEEHQGATYKGLAGLKDLLDRQR